MQLNTDSWKEFYISRKGHPGLFDITYGKCRKTECLEDGDEIDYVGAKRSENGVVKKVKKNAALTSKGNGISFVLDSKYSTGYTNYIPEDFICALSVAIGYDNMLNPFNGLFLVTILNREQYRYSYGRKYRGNIHTAKIKLPALWKEGSTKYSEHGYVPDWDFMERYIKRLGFSNTSLRGLEKNPLLLDKKKWSSFSVPDLFTVTRGIRLVHDEDYIDEKNEEYFYPVISTTTTNNGVDGYYKESNFSGNCLISAGQANGMFTTYQKDHFWALDSVRVLRPVGFTLNPCRALFLCTVLGKEQYRFSYGRKASIKNIEELSIQLPVDENGDPDWNFMEDYIKRLPYGDRVS